MFHNVNAGEFLCCGMFQLVKERQMKIDNAHCLAWAIFQQGGYEAEISLV